MEFPGKRLFFSFFWFILIKFEWAHLQARHNMNRSSNKNCSNSTAIIDTNLISNATENNTLSTAPDATSLLNSTISSNCRFNHSETENNAFVAILRISALVKEDEQNVLNLSITNELGKTYYTVRITNIEGKALSMLSELWLINNFYPKRATLVPSLGLSSGWLEVFFCLYSLWKMWTSLSTFLGNLSKKEKCKIFPQDFLSGNRKCKNRNLQVPLVLNNSFKCWEASA